MEPIVDLAPGAESSTLGRFFAERIRTNLGEPATKNTFRSLKATVFVVGFDTGEAATLRFDHGRLTVHEGTIGMPTITFGGPERALLSLDRLRLRDLGSTLLGERAEVALVESRERRLSSIPPPSSRNNDRLELRELLRLLTQGELKIYGWLAHPRTTLRFLRLIASR